MNIADTNTAKLWMTPEQLAELEYERQREEYEREQIATALSEQQWEEACKTSQQR